MIDATPVAIIGAGPYGLSIAAHLRGRGVPFRIFGNPMASWTRHMPKGMCLKSDGVASSLSDPKGKFTLERFCADQGLEYRHQGYAVPLSTLTAYGLAFQRRFVPEVEDKMVVGLERSPSGFILSLDDGQNVAARAVIVAIGIDPFRQMPQSLAALPKAYATHSSEHHELSRFAGRAVAIIGGGSSGIDLAGLLHEAGAQVTLVHRRPIIRINPPLPSPRPLWDRIRAPMNDIGPGWSTLFCAKAPTLFYHLPEHIRIRVFKHLIPPAAGWWMNGRIIGRVSLLLGHLLQRAEARDGQVHLHLHDANGTPRELVADHVIAATGFRPAIERIGFLSDDIRAHLRSVERVPDLSPHFETSVPGLYFAGPISTYNFGPVVRFIAGVPFTARHLSKRLAACARAA